MVSMRPKLWDYSGAGRSDWVYVGGDISRQAGSCVCLLDEHGQTITKATNKVVGKCQYLRSCCWKRMDTVRPAGLHSLLLLPMLLPFFWWYLRVPSPFPLRPSLVTPDQCNLLSSHNLLAQSLVSSYYLGRRKRDQVPSISQCLVICTDCFPNSLNNPMWYVPAAPRSRLRKQCSGSLGKLTKIFYLVELAFESVQSV